MKYHYNHFKEKAIEYKPKDKVWLKGKNLWSTRLTKKFTNKQYGPFKNLEKIGSSAYRLKIPKSWTGVYLVFNEILLSPYHEPTYSGQKKPPPPLPIEVEGHPEYEVEAILGMRKCGRGMQYLVKWKGYGPEENTWESAQNVKDVQALDEYFDNHPQACQLRLVCLMALTSEMTL